MTERIYTATFRRVDRRFLARQEGKCSIRFHENPNKVVVKFADPIRVKPWESLELKFESVVGEEDLGKF